MTSYQAFVLNPSYTGPMIIAETFKKLKTNSGLNRMLSAHNKRYFVLDLNHMTFYYLPDKTCHFADSTSIAIPSITGIKVTNLTKGLEDDKVWKHEFVIITQKKMFELLSDSKATMDKILFAFSNIINTKTNKPLFNWDHYTGVSQVSSPCHIPLNTQSPELTNQGAREERFTSPQSSPAKRSEQALEEDTQSPLSFQPEQTGEITPEIARIREAIRTQEREIDNKSSDGQSDDQKEQKQRPIVAKKRQASLGGRRKGAGFAAMRGKGFEVSDQDENQANENRSNGSPSKRVEVESPVEQAETGTTLRDAIAGYEAKQKSPEKTEKLQIKIELLSLDKVEPQPENKVDYNIREDRQIDSLNEIKRRMNPGEESHRRRQAHSLTYSKTNKSASMKNMYSKHEEKGFVGMNEIDLSSQKKTYRQNQLSYAVPSISSEGPAKSSVRLGTGMRIAHAKSQEVKQDIDWSPAVNAGHELKKFSLFREGIESSPSKKENLVINKKSHADEDWDNEMFGPGENQVSPLKPKKQEAYLRQSSGTKYDEKKNQLNQLTQRRTEFVTNRQGTHNEWDDDL